MNRHISYIKQFMTGNRKLKLTVILILFVVVTYAQKSIIEERSVSKQFAIKEMNKSMILSRAEAWFTNEVNAEKNEVESIDKESGIIVINGVSEVLYKNIGRELYPKRSGMAEVLEARFGHQMKVKVNENDYEITYTVIDMKEEMYKKEDLFFACVDFESLKEENLEAYNKAMNKLLKANLVFKKRRELFMDNSKFQFEEVSGFLLTEGETNIFSLNEAITLQ